MNYQSIGKEKAIAMYESKWWEGLNSKQVVKFQLFTNELCMPFDQFHKAIETELGRPVFTHEFGPGRDNLALEFLGERDAPSLDEILDLIPEEKRIVIQI
jgi:hypothetical protein